MDNVYAKRIENLRALMRAKAWDAVILTGSDPHGSEYPACRWKQVEWLTGFTGEAGDVVITLDHAGLWTDTRYFIQANIQLEGTGVVLHKTRIPEQVLIPQWLGETLAADSIVAVDGLCQNAADMAELSENFQLVSVPDLLDVLWTDRPLIPQTPIISVSPGESLEEKLSWLRAVLAEKGCDAALVSGLDGIAWLLNVRGEDIDYNPFVISYLLVGEDYVKWFVLKGEIEDPDTSATFDSLLSQGIELLPYEDAALALSEFEGTLLVDSGTLNYHLSSLLSCRTVSEQSPVNLRKAVKNPVELEGMRRAHIVDGVAMEKFLYWLERSLDNGKIITEWDASVKLGQLRAAGEGYMGDSFETIAAYGPGAALPHYITPRENAPILHQQGLFLCDSGAQYLYGTTDITRTVPLGECSRLEMEDYTIDLKGHIDLSMAVFPAGTAGCQIDAIAREPLWKAGRNFGHGTGHGVGYFLGVHEGPQDIRQNFNTQPLLPGMIISNEPGIYREGMHGIRHENLVLVTELPATEFGRWYGFDTLTLCHFDTSAILKEMMSPSELEWLNAYNSRVYETLAPLLPAEIAEWLKVKTAAI
ncbi:MAG: aminopeptidase P family protein [Bacteroidales bacterium]|nr:aminopeptidase P family protein [Bacteroidales bacterium]